jgi:hypothetical protein
MILAIHRSNRFGAFGVLLASMLLTLSEANASNLTINLTFDNSFQSAFSANLTAAENAANYAAQQFQNNFSDPVTLNIKVSGSVGTSIFGQSNANYLGYTNYSTIKSALSLDAKTANDASAVASLPTTDPTGSNSGNVFVFTQAEGKALGLVSSNTSDGTMTFGNGFNYSFDPNQRAVTGSYDFIGLVEHEISEVMGRAGITGATTGNGLADFSPLDLFRYTAAGALAPSNNGAGVYFSINGGTTNLHYFNNAASNHLDTADWANFQAQYPNDSFNQYANVGTVNDISPLDLMVMDAIGWDLIVPEPSTFALAGLGIVGVIARTLRRRPLSSHN